MTHPPAVITRAPALDPAAVVTLCSPLIGGVQHYRLGVPVDLPLAAEELLAGAVFRVLPGGEWRPVYTVRRV